MTAIGINGFGRIGRLVLRAARGNPKFDVKLINDITDAKTMAHLFKYDSNYGIYPGEVKAEDKTLIIDGKRIAVSSERDPANLPWKALGVEVVLECTGKFMDQAGGDKHLQAGAKKVVFSAPAKGEGMVTVVKGVNHKDYDKSKHSMVSNASCTTNCLAPVIKVINDSFGIKHGLMTTVHAYTNDQATLDQPHKDLRRARAAGLSMIPTTTGAARAIGLVIPSLKGKLDGLAIRVPTPTVSVVDMTLEVNKATTVEAVNAALKAAADGPMKGILGFSSEPLVSVDFKGDSRSSIVDAESTSVMSGTLVKIVTWYDNEWGFSNRMAELATELL
ncbi:MAG: type I glyceraldehyde-3-phosphate dehydrogenase [Deltaproteobacteria bacterium]|nr:type I glyceraldehyde-3-phosphate dehydrogenase [Deltaproteobacteria bacterium]